MPNIPKYIKKPLKRQAPDKLEKIGRYCFDLAEEKRTNTIQKPQTKPEKEQLKNKNQPVRQEEYINCGDDCQGCPHGAYIYEYKWDKEKKKVVSNYIGKKEEVET